MKINQMKRNGRIHRLDNRLLWQQRFFFGCILANTRKKTDLFDANNHYHHYQSVHKHILVDRCHHCSHQICYSVEREEFPNDGPKQKSWATNNGKSMSTVLCEWNEFSKKDGSTFIPEKIIRLKINEKWIDFPENDQKQTKKKTYCQNNNKKKIDWSI